ncbi:SulP family inorganic anion transporter [Maribacter sp. 2-571]|uniref:SulP family inorganic anion transporter n=1 Tax=Maribacter sp. 2-571 TaxID=3417569 RepID=UPI003D3426C4
MRRFLPILEWLPLYQKQDLKRDLVAGLTVGIVLVPQGMAYAMIAGLPPVYGLYAALLPLVFYALLGTSRQVSTGPVAMDSLLVAAGLGALQLSGTENYITAAIVLCLMVGAIQLLLGILRMGFLVNFLSKPVINGFTSGAAIIIIFSQLRHLLGVEIEKSTQFYELVGNAMGKLGDTNLYDLGIGLSGILIILLIKKWDKRIPAVLLVVILGVLCMYFIAPTSLGIKIVGEVPIGFPKFDTPNISLELISRLWSIALVLALVGYLETISIGKAMEERNHTDYVNANQELIALGTANIVGSFFQSYGSTASFSRSAINFESGGRTPMSGVFAAALVLLTLFFLTPVFYYLPKAVLASIIMVSVVGLVDLKYPKLLWRLRKDEFAVLCITFLGTLTVGITGGILIGVLLSLLLMVYRTSQPHFAILGNIGGSDYYKNVNRFEGEALLRDDLLVVRFDAQLYFGNSAYFKKILLRYVDQKGGALRAVILNAEAINYIDATGTRTLIAVIEELHERQLQFYIAGAIGPIRDIFYSNGIIDCLREECLFVKVKEAVAHFDDPRYGTPLQDKIAHQNKTSTAEDLR